MAKPGTLISSYGKTIRHYETGAPVNLITNFVTPAEGSKWYIFAEYKEGDGHGGETTRRVSEGEYLDLVAMLTGPDYGYVKLG